MVFFNLTVLFYNNHMAAGFFQDFCEYSVHVCLPFFYFYTIITLFFCDVYHHLLVFSALFQNLKTQEK